MLLLFCSTFVLLTGVISAEADSTLDDLKVQANSDIAYVYEDAELYSFLYTDPKLQEKLTFTLTRNSSREVINHEKYSFFILTRDVPFVADKNNIRVRDKLDYEAVREYIFDVEALDSEISLTKGYKKITVKVINVNDNKPYFNPDAYNVRIREGFYGQLNKISIAKLNASDQDNENMTFAFENIEESRRGLFELDSRSGIIYCVNTVSVGKFTFSVRVTDNGLPYLSALAQVLITVEPRVDSEIPKFDLITTYYELTEVNEFQTFFAKINAYTINMVNTLYMIDSSSNFSFILQDIDDNDDMKHFSVHHQGLTAFINHARVMDIDTRDEYSFILTTTEADPQNPQDFEAVHIRVSTVWNNKNRLVVSNTPAYVTIKESALPGSTVFKPWLINGLQDYRYHPSVTPQLTFMLLSLTRELFTITSFATGEVVLADSLLLDRNTSQYELLVIAFDRTGNTHFPVSPETPVTLPAVGDVVVNVVRSLPPEFLEPKDKVVVKAILENTTVGEDNILFTYTAMDPDYEFEFSLEKYLVIGDKIAKELFTVNETTGGVSLRKSLSTDSSNSYNVILAAQDKTGLRDTITIVVPVGRNLQYPVFNQSIYRVLISDAITASESFLTVAAYDEDTYPPYNEVLYSLIYESPYKRLFSINKTTGNLSRVGDLTQYPEVKRYELHIRATDRGSPGKDSKDLAIVLVDVRREGSPYFTYFQYNESISLHHGSSSPVFTPTLFDNKTSFPHRDLTVKIIHQGAFQEIFEIRNKRNSTIFLKPGASLGWIDREIMIKIEVKDTSHVPKSSTADVVFKVVNSFVFGKDSSVETNSRIENKMFAKCSTNYETQALNIFGKQISGVIDTSSCA